MDQNPVQKLPRQTKKLGHRPSLQPRKKNSQQTSTAKLPQDILLTDTKDSPSENEDYY